MLDRVVTLHAPAKVNFRLRVLAREETGYHSLETVFCAVSLADTLRLREGDGSIHLTVSGGIPVGPPEDNLVVRAARRFFRELGRPPSVRIELHKRIPAAAGLGGGSTDAAAMLRALNTLHNDVFRPATLLQWAIELGSDVPFFLGGSPLALGWSRGERLLTLPPLPPRPILIAYPGQPMPTAGAFQRIAELRSGYSPVAESLSLRAVVTWDGMAELASNDFEAIAFEQLPILAKAKEVLQAEGASIALLAGSGASLFGVFPNRETLTSAASKVAALGFSTWEAKNLQLLPAPEVSAG